MPVFRSAPRRRPLRSQSRRRTSTRWAPPGRSAFPAPSNLATFYDRFEETTLKPWWRNTGDGQITTGASVVFSPGVGEYSYLESQYPFDFLGTSITFEVTIPAATFADTGRYMEIGVMKPAGFDTRFEWALYVYSGDWIADVRIGDPGFSQYYVTTTAAEWRFIRFSSDPVSPTVVTAYRSPDGYVWTTLGSHTFASTSDLTAVVIYMLAQGSSTGGEMMTVNTVSGGGGSAPVSFAPIEFTPVTEYVVRLTKPLVGPNPEFRWVREGAWQYAEVPLGASGSADSPSLTWEVNRAGQVKVEIDQWRFAQIWGEANFDPGGSGVRYLVPESTTLWVFRGTQPLWAGYLRDIDADPTGNPNVVITGEEFIGQFTDINLTHDWSINAEPTSTALDLTLTREIRTAWMHTHYHGGGITGTFSAAYTQLEQRRLSEIIEQLAVAGQFEWQQWIGPPYEAGHAWETYFGVHPGKAGYDYQTQGMNIEWGLGTQETAWSVRYGFSGRGMRTRWSVIGEADTIKIRDYNIPLGVPRRDGSVRNSAIPADLVAEAAEQMVRRQGLPQLTVRATLRVGDQPGQWPFLWLYGTAGTPGTGGCSPVGSRFFVKVAHAGMEYAAILRASTWGIAVVPGGEYMVLDLVQDEAAAAGLILEMQTVV